MQPYAMPPVEVGDTVIWHSDGDANTEPLPAMVTRVGNGTVSLAVFQPHVINIHPPTGVMHVGDPRIKTGGYNGSGAWDYRPKSKEWRDRMEKALDKLAGQTTAKKS